MTQAPEGEIRPATAAAFEEEPSQVSLPPPSFLLPPHLRVWAWARVNLFATPFNSLLTLACLWLLGRGLWALLDWGLVSAHLSGGLAACQGAQDADGGASGACWAVVPQKYRLILFGLYPHEEHWRPVLATGIFLSLLALSSRRSWWRRELLLLWLAGLVAMGLLMWGGVFGLSYVENARWGGLPLTLFLSVFGIALAFPLALVLALGRQSTLPVLRGLSVGFIELFRGVPLVTVLFMASVMFPLFLPEGVEVDKLLRALVGITLFTAAYLAEAVRGGLQAIPRGQYEAAEALGLGYWRKTSLIILPQALRLVIPPLVNQFISCFKDTSLVTVVGLYDLLTSAKAALSDPEWRPYFVETYLFTALIYWGFCFFMSRYSQGLERDLKTGTQH